MRTRSVSLFYRTSTPIILLLMCVFGRISFAQNENEAVGFQTTHVFESGQFGENIDTLNGNLSLGMPIGSRFQVNDRLSYQLGLSYNSKIWDYSDYSAGNQTTVRAIGKGPLGIGFTLGVGRIIEDAHSSTSCSNGPGCYQRNWKWVAPDGGQHDVWFLEDYTSTHPMPDASLSPLKTSDATYTRVFFDSGCYDGEAWGACRTVQTADGLTYGLGHRIFYADSTDPGARNENLNWGGWYVTRIEDKSVGSPDPGTQLYPNYVLIRYDTRTNFEHAIREIRDSRGRVITFHNCAYDTNGNCVDTPTTAATSRAQVATYAIDVPGFSGLNGAAATEAVSASKVVTYSFKYEYRTVAPAFPDAISPTPVGPLLLLKRVDYPAYTHRDGTSETYSVYYGYPDPGGAGDYGEMDCRTLPITRDTTKSCKDFIGTRSVFSYFYDYYYYAPFYFAEGPTRSGGNGKLSRGLAFSATPSRQIVRKSLTEPSSAISNWYYARDAGQGITNPWRVTSTDAVGNDTVYLYNTSLPPSSPTLTNGQNPEDGLAPEWNDGLNYRIEYYKGTARSGGTRTLVRSENRDYDSDTTVIGNVVQHENANSRVRRAATVYNDGGNVESVVANSNWDKFGNWQTVAESGYKVPGIRTTQTDYYAIDTGTVYVTGVSHFREVHNGQTVLERTDNGYGADGRLEWTIGRKTPPPSLGTPVNTAAADGDVKTTYTYDTNRILKTKTLLSKGDGATADYCIDYAWVLDSFLKSKTFKDCATQTALPWKAIDRQRDGNTGLIYSSKDTAGFETIYTYDALGRVTDIKPTAPEYATAVDYVTLRETTVKRNPAGTTDFQFSRYRYDDLGRLTCEETRRADSTNTFKTTRYNPLGWTVFQSEWLPQSTTSQCDPATTVGTTFDFGTPADAFGRPVQQTTADGKVTTTSYYGQDTTVTVKGVVTHWDGFVTTPVLRDNTTTYGRDAFNRLVAVDMPSNGGADATYIYDLRDNLVRVDLYEQANPTRKQSRFFVYDGLGRLYTSTNPESNTVIYNDYDAMGNLRSMTDAAGSTFVSAYDAAGRQKTLVRAGMSGGPLIANYYDGAVAAYGKLSRVDSSDDAGAPLLTKSLTYGGLNGRLSAFSSSITYFSNVPPTLKYTYDNYGNVWRMDYPEGKAGKGGAFTALYQFANGIPVSTSDLTGFSLASVTYNPAGGVASLTTPGPIRTNIAPDSRNRPSSITIGKWSGTSFRSTFYASGTYSYDGGGNIWRIQNGTTDNRYSYDGANRVTDVYELYPDNKTGYKQCFSYDDFGNITSKQDYTYTSNFIFINCGIVTNPTVSLEVSNPLTFANSNRINKEVRKNIGEAPFTYDSNGNLTKDWQRRYQYDSRNRLAAIQTVSSYLDPATTPVTTSDITRYVYDGDGNRIASESLQRDQAIYYFRGPDGNLLSEFRRPRLSADDSEWYQHHIYLAGREVSLRENRLPNPPGGLTLSLASGQVKLQWRKNPAEDSVTSYKVYRGFAFTTYSLLASTSTACVDPDFICFTDISPITSDRSGYYVSAVSSLGESLGSAPLLVNVGNPAPPLSPTCLTAVAGDGKVTLSWIANTSMDHNIYRGSQTNRINVGPVHGTSYVDAGLTNGQTYTYWITAVDVVGNEAWIDNNGCAVPGLCMATPHDTTPPAPPRNPAAVGDCTTVGSLTLTWEAPADADLQGYLIERQPPLSGSNPKDVGNALTYLDTGLTEGDKYSYRVAAYDNAGNRSAFTTWIGARLRVGPTQMKSPPGQLITKAGDGQVTVRFDKPAVTTGIDKYVIYRKINPGSSCANYVEARTINASDWPNSSFIEAVDGSVTNNFAWDYAVASRDAAGRESLLSKSSLAIPLSPAKHFRQCVQDPPLDSGAGQVGACGSRLVLRWDPPSDSTTSSLLGFHGGRYSQRIDNGNDHSLIAESPYRFPIPNSFSNRCPVSNTYNCHSDSDCLWRGDSCVEMGLCYVKTQTSCSSNADCANGTACYRTCSSSSERCASDTDCPGGASDRCTGPSYCAFTGNKNDFLDCIQSSDCGAAGYCSLQSGHYDPYLMPTTQMIAYYPWQASLTECATFSAAYRIGVNNHLEVAVSDWNNFDVNQLSTDVSGISSRCLQPAYDACASSAPRCDANLEPAAVTVGPQATLSQSGSVTVTWEPPTDLTNVAGYRLTVREVPRHPDRAPSIYQSARELPSITVGSRETSYELVGVPRDWRIGYEFQIVAFGPDGRSAVPSPVSEVIWTMDAPEPVPPLLADSALQSEVAEVPLLSAAAVTSPLSPPRHLKAWARIVRNGASVQPSTGVYLKWCPNRPAEGVTGYRIYRSAAKEGPYTLHAQIDNPTDPATFKNNCLSGSAACTITSACQGTTCSANPPNGCTDGSCSTPAPGNCTCPTITPTFTCTVGQAGTCKILDKVNLVSGSRYYYAVTALRGTEESSFSEKNAAWTNFCGAVTGDDHICNWGIYPNTFPGNYDPDNEQDINCEGEQSLSSLIDTAPLGNDGDAVASGRDQFADASVIGGRPAGVACGVDPTGAPYRMIGGAGGPSPNKVGGNTGFLAVPRYLFYHADHLGNPRVIADVNGVVVSMHHFLPFGEEKPLTTARASSNTRMFTGHERDFATATSDTPDGVDYMLARYYSSSLGRFMEVDPSRSSVSPGNPQSWNRYAYTLNNPINLVDPDGQTVLTPSNNQSHYDVKGKTLSQIAPKLTKHQGFASATTGTLKVTNVTSNGTVGKLSNGTYSATLSVKSADVQAVTNTDSPNWVNSSSASPAAQQEFSRFSEATDTHEGGHVAIMNSAAAPLDAALPGLSATGTGATAADATAAANAALGGKVQAATNAAVADADAKNSAYETSTGHGATQGAVLDTTKDKKK